MTSIAVTSAQTRKRTRASHQQWIGLLYVAPAVALVVVFFLIPLGMTAWMSLHNWPLMGEHSYIGLGNYVAILRDTRFWNALKFTAYYTVIVTTSVYQPVKRSAFQNRVSRRIAQ